MTYKKHRIQLLTTYLMLAMLFIACAIPASAAEIADNMPNVAAVDETGSEFDFSSSDSIDKYDAYKKQELVTSSENTIIYVDAAATRGVDTIREMDANQARYGAYLRDNTEVQRYVFYNIDTKRTGTTMCNNTLTIYADPEVQFTVTDINDNLVINSNGQKNSSVVKYYNKTEDNGNYIYYIELIPGVSGKTRCIVEFSTSSASVQPHYSFWYGAPLVKRAAVNGGSFSVSATWPSTSSYSYSLRAPGNIPRRAWIETVSLKNLTTRGDSNVSFPYLSVTYPGATSGTKFRIIQGEMDYKDFPSNVSSHDAAGTYKFALTNLRWSSGIKVPVTYQCEADVTFHYIYAFGA